MSAQQESSAEEIQRLRRCINDIVSILGLPATWGGSEPSRIVGDLLAAVLNILSLDFVYARVRDPMDTGLELVRTAKEWEPKPGARSMGEILHPWLKNDTQNSPPPVRCTLEGREMSVVSLQLGVQGETGIVIAGSCRVDFPQQTEKLLLSVAANQAAVGLQAASLLRAPTRVASELDQRVAQRTAELAASNTELRKEIAERESVEKRLRQEEVGFKHSEAHKAAILDSSLDCIVAMDHEGRITEFNAAAERTFGYSKQSVLGKHLTDVLIPPSLREKHHAGFSRYLATGESRVLGQHLEMAALCSDGREIPVELAITRIQQEGPPSFTGYLRDITERKRNENALLATHAKLAQSEQRWRSVFENSAIGVALTALNGRFVATNPVYQRMLGYTEAELQQRSFLDITVEEDRIPSSALVEELLQGKRKQFQVEKQYHRKNGSAVWVRNSVSMLPGSDQKPQFLMALSEDITEQHEAKAALDKARSELAHVARTSTLSALTASIAHEINQPLSGIVTNAGTCLRMLDADPPNLQGARETSRRTIRDGNRASEVITRLRALFSNKVVPFESFDLNEAAKEVFALSESELQQNRVIPVLLLSASLPSVLGDRIQIQQVILNLIRNGSDAMSTVADRPRELLIKTESDGSVAVRLSVTDTGVGIDPIAEQKLFEAFYTTKNDGMGVGLYVSRSIVESHQGRLWANQNLGPGATFSFSIPCSSTNT